jgi:hypothetical protein
MTRTGKIARLPRHIRDQLNRHLDDGEPGNRLVEWLNSLDEVKDMLYEDFGGRPVSEQNLSDWKQGGFLDWQQQQYQSCEWVRAITSCVCFRCRSSWTWNTPRLIPSATASPVHAIRTSRLHSVRLAHFDRNARRCHRSRPCKLSSFGAISSAHAANRVLPTAAPTRLSPSESD